MRHPGHLRQPSGTGRTLGPRPGGGGRRSAGRRRRDLRRASEACPSSTPTSKATRRAGGTAICARASLKPMPSCSSPPSTTARSPECSRTPSTGRRVRLATRPRYAARRWSRRRQYRPVRRSLGAAGSRRVLGVAGARVVCPDLPVGRAAGRVRRDRRSRSSSWQNGSRTHVAELVREAVPMPIARLITLARRAALQSPLVAVAAAKQPPLGMLSRKEGPRLRGPSRTWIPALDLVEALPARCPSTARRESRAPYAG